jgi:hypothetical protein
VTQLVINLAHSTILHADRCPLMTLGFGSALRRRWMNWNQFVQATNILYRITLRPFLDTYSKFCPLFTRNLSSGWPPRTGSSSGKKKKKRFRGPPTAADRLKFVILIGKDWLLSCRVTWAWCEHIMILPRKTNRMKHSRAPGWFLQAPPLPVVGTDKLKA